MGAGNVKCVARCWRVYGFYSSQASQIATSGPSLSSKPNSRLQSTYFLDGLEAHSLIRFDLRLILAAKSLAEPVKSRGEQIPRRAPDVARGTDQKHQPGGREETEDAAGRKAHLPAGRD